MKIVLFDDFIDFVIFGKFVLFNFVLFMLSINVGIEYFKEGECRFLFM